MRKYDKHAAQTATAMVALSILSTAGVQARAAETSNSERQEGELGLEQIVVTAQRTSQNIQSVPVAISALTADELQSRGVFSLEAMKNVVPNLSVEQNLSNVGTPKIFMRGVGQANSAFSFDSPIGIYVDDVYYAKQVGAMVDFFDIERIEVLRGPQGTIYGRNSSIGAVRVVTRSAPLDESDGRADVTVGSERQRNARISFGAPLIDDKLGFRIAFNSKYNRGYQTNTVNGERAGSEDSNAVRGQLLSQFSDRISMTLRGDYLRDDSRPFVATNFITGDPASLRYQSNLLYSTDQARSRLETYGASATLKWDLGGIDLTSISAWRGVKTQNGFDADGTTNSRFEVPRSDLDDGAFTQEVFLSGSGLGSAPIDWIGGFFYLRESTDYVYSMRVIAPPTVQTYDQDVESIAGYFQGTYHATDRLGLTAGLRYTTEDKEFAVQGVRADGSFDFAYADNDLPTDRWTWRAAADYQFDVPVLLYASAETGFRSGGLNGNAQTLADVTGGAVKPEDSTMYEIGIKSEFADRRLRINANYYYGEYEHLQTPVVEDNGFVNTTNSSATVHGLELEARVRPIAPLEISATVGTLSQSVDNSSKDLPNAPSLMWGVAGSYEYGVGALGVLTLSAQYNHTGSSFLNAANTLQTKVDAHENLDAQLSLTTADEHWQFTLAGLNLTDESYAIGGFYIAGGAISAVKWPNLPRRWTASAQYRF
jgi:iron complex outermembrane receptor protein